MGEPGRAADYEAGLDGLRAVAVVAVVLFHSDFAWARGGFLGVSIFFTLSGFLITRLLLVEQQRSGTIGLRAFWVRRVRRLAPASLLCLGLVAVCIPWFEASARIATVRGDLVAAVGYSANWRFVLAEQSYADLFVGGPSPVLHFWSLAIEEQFYVIYPIIVAGACWAATRLRRRWPVPVTLAMLAAASIAAGLLTTDRDLYYYGTHTRASEFLIGALVAVAWLRSKRLSRWLQDGSGRLPSAAALVACLVTAAVILATEQGDAWLYRGGFPLLAVLWATLIAGAMTPGPVRAALSATPMVLLGRLSFGVYLFHWPIFQLVTPARLGAADWRLHALRWGLTLAVAVASYVLVEQPIRTKRVRLRQLTGGLTFVAAMAAVVVLAMVISPRPLERAATAMAEAPDELVSFSDPPTAVLPATVGGASTVSRAEAPVVVLLGSQPGLLAEWVKDSASLVGDGSQPAVDAPGVDVIDLAQSGCTFLRVGAAGSGVDSSGRACRGPAATLAGYLREGGRVDALVLSFGEDDHVAVAERLSAGLVDGIAGVARHHDEVERDLNVLESLRDLAGGAPIALVDEAVTAPDPLTQILREAATTHSNVTLVASSRLTEHVAATAQHLPSTADTRTRVMVIGDSTSYGVAEQVDELAADRYDVVWAGRRNCPFVSVTRVRWWEGAEFDMGDCQEAQAAWPQVAADFRPDVLLVLASLPELSDQRYPGDDSWYAIGDAEYERQHLAALRHLTKLVEPFDAITLVADTPTSDWTESGRVSAFNARLEVWLARLPRASVLTYGEYVEEAEAAVGHSLRPDNVHLAPEALRTIVAERLLPQLDAAVQAATADNPPS